MRSLYRIPIILFLGILMFFLLTSDIFLFFNSELLINVVLFCIFVIGLYLSNVYDFYIELFYSFVLTYRDQTISQSILLYIYIISELMFKKSRLYFIRHLFNLYKYLYVLMLNLYYVLYHYLLLYLYIQIEVYFVFVVSYIVQIMLFVFKLYSLLVNIGTYIKKYIYYIFELLKFGCFVSNLYNNLYYHIDHIVCANISNYTELILNNVLNY